MTTSYTCDRCQKEGKGRPGVVRFSAPDGGWGYPHAGDRTRDLCPACWGVVREAAIPGEAEIVRYRQAEGGYRG